MKGDILSYNVSSMLSMKFAEVKVYFNNFNVLPYR